MLRPRRAPRRGFRWSLLAIGVAVLATPAPAGGQTALAGDLIQIGRLESPVTIDGDLSDEAWQHATRIDRWYETQPGDNVEPKVRNVGYLAYDDRYLYAAFEFDDPRPSAMRAPFADRDDIGNGYDDYGGILLDPRNTGSTGVFFVVTPRNIQYDSITDDASGENSSPDFFWDSATRITPNGWTLEMRIPFSSLRYRNVAPQTWRILLYRNYPREFHYQFYSARLPRNGNCFVCRANVLAGLEGLPAGGHIVAAPYVSSRETAQPAADLGTPLVNGSLHARAGIDVKYLPNADNAIDFTLKPDFSQVESDTPQISTNQRFALFFPEKRPFFLEGVDLFATPIQAVYTRTIATPEAGGRITGKTGGMRYTVLVADDAGGGSAVLPGATSSSLADVDFGSTVTIARAKRDIGLSFAGMLLTDRENRSGDGHNRVVGPDVQWRPAGTDVVSGQWLFSDTTTPNRPDVADEWTGRSFTGHDGMAQWNHNATHLDWSGIYRDVSEGFRADSGFVPQVGYRETYAQTGWTFRPTGFLSRLRTFLNADRLVDPSGTLVSRELLPGVGMDTRLNGFMQFRYVDDRIRTSRGPAIGRRQFGYTLQFSPSRFLTQVSADGALGQDIDFDNARPGHGATINLSATLRPTNHLELALIGNQQWLNVNDTAGTNRRLFVARVTRLKGTYTFTSRLFLRSIAEYVSTNRDPSLYIDAVAAADGDFSGSLLLAYKLNWQSVMFVGYGDDRELTAGEQLAGLDRQVFVKISYALQR